MVFVVATLVVVLSILPGYLLMAHFRVPDDDELLLVPLCFLLSFVCISTIQFILFVLGIFVFWAGLLALVVLCAGLWFSVCQRGVSLPLLPYGWLGCHVLFVVYLCIMLMVTPTYAVAFTSDWGLYYPVSLLFTGKANLQYFTQGVGWEYLAKRTPLYALYGAYFMGFCGQMYSVFQTACVVANSMIFWAVLVVVSRIGRRDVMVTAGLLLLCAPGMMRAILAPEPKIFATVLTLLAWRLYSGHGSDCAESAGGERAKGLRSVFCAGTAVVSVMCHPSMLFYVVWLYVHQIWRVMQSRRLAAADRQFWTASVGFSLAFLLGWLGWLGSTFGLAAALRPSLTVSEPLPMGVVAYILTRAGMIVYTLVVPKPLLVAVLDGTIFTSGGGFLSWVSSSGDQFARYYQQTYLGATGTAVTLSAVAWWFTHSPGRMPRDPILNRWWWWGIGGALICFGLCVGVTDYKGHALNMTAPLYLLAFTCIASTLSRLGPIAKGILWCSVIAEFVYVRLAVILLAPGREQAGLQYVAADTLDWLRGLGLVAVALFLVLVVAAYGYLLRKTSISGTRPAIGDSV